MAPSSIAAVVVLLITTTTTPGVTLAVPEIESAAAMPRNEASLPAATRTDWPAGGAACCSS